MAHIYSSLKLLDCFQMNKPFPSVKNSETIISSDQCFKKQLNRELVQFTFETWLIDLSQN